MLRGKHVNTVEAKNRLNELIAEVNQTHQPLIVQKRGEPVAVVLDYQSYNEKFSQERRESDETLLQELKAFHKHLQKKYPKGTGEAVEILRDIREERGRR